MIKKRVAKVFPKSISISLKFACKNFKIETRRDLQFFRISYEIEISFFPWYWTRIKVVRIIAHIRSKIISYGHVVQDWLSRLTITGFVQRVPCIGKCIILKTLTFFHCYIIRDKFWRMGSILQASDHLSSWFSIDTHRIRFKINQSTTDDKPSLVPKLSEKLPHNIQIFPII